MTESDIKTQITTLVGQGDTDEQIIAALLAAGMMVEQISFASDRSKFVRKWEALKAQLTSAPPTLTTEQLTALVQFIEAKVAFDSTDLDACAKEAISVARAGDTDNSISAFVILVASLYTIRPAMLD